MCHLVFRPSRLVLALALRGLVLLFDALEEFSDRASDLKQLWERPRFGRAHWINFSSSLLLALIGGVGDFLEPPLVNNHGMPKAALRVPMAN